MNVAKLITILQTLPMDSKVQISYSSDQYAERPTEADVHAFTFREAENYPKHPDWNKPSRVILS